MRVLIACEYSATVRDAMGQPNMSNLIRLHGNGPLVSQEVDAILCHWRATYRISIGKSIDAAIRFCASHPDFIIQAPAPDDTPRRGHRTPLNKEQKERIICLFREEKRTQKEIAAEYGIHINTVRNICKTQPLDLI